MAGGGGVEVADILITVEKRRLVRHVLELESFGDANLEIGFTNIISAAIVRVSEAVERESKVLEEEGEAVRSFVMKKSHPVKI